jgi:hypothetical protein
MRHIVVAAVLLLLLLFLRANPSSWAKDIISVVGHLVPGLVDVLETAV